MYYRFLPILKAHSHIKTVSQLHGPPALPCNSYLRLCRCSVSKSRALPFTTKSGVAWPWVSVEPLSVGTLYHVIQSLLQTSRIYKHLQTLSSSDWTWLHRNCTCVLDIILQKGKEAQGETKTCDVDIETRIESRHGTWVGFFHGCNTLPMLQPCNHYTVTTQCANVRYVRAPDPSKSVQSLQNMENRLSEVTHSDTGKICKI